ncbi:hypothetical protein NMG60_11031651 [Bertholletia excelsa]
MSSSDHLDGVVGAHVLVFPFPAPGHIIPFLDLVQILINHGIKVTVLVTPPQLPLLDPILSSIQTLVLSPPDLPPTTNSSHPGILTTLALRCLSKPIIQWFRSHPYPPVAIISDLLLGWTQELARDLGVPRVVFWTSGASAASVYDCVWRDLPTVDDPDDENSIISIPTLPNSPTYTWWQMSPQHRGFKKGDPGWEFFRNSLLANFGSWGAVLNSFTELERVYIDHMKKEMGHDRVWAVGPLLASDDDVADSTERGGYSSQQIHEVISWLDSKEEESVVYICFGSRWTITTNQAVALAAAIEHGFESRVEGKGFILRGWAPQVAILRHRAVGAFVSHCGWNSTLEAITAGVLMLTWPLGADQFINAKLLVDELGVAVIFFEDGNRTTPDPAELSRLLGESVSGKWPERPRVMELSKAAKEAPGGGSSSRDMEALVQQLVQLGRTTIPTMDN